MREGSFSPEKTLNKPERIKQLKELLAAYRADVDPDTGRLSGQDLLDAEREIELMEKELAELEK